MKTLLLVYDFDINTGETQTNKGYFSLERFDFLLSKINRMKKCYIQSGCVRDIKRGWIFTDFDPIHYINRFN